MIPEPAAKVPLETDRLITVMFGLGIVGILALGVVGRSKISVTLVVLYIIIQPVYLIAKTIKTDEEGEQDEGNQASESAGKTAAESTGSTVNDENQKTNDEPAPGDEGQDRGNDNES